MNPKRLIHCWKNMIRRCTNPKVGQYRDYGGRGITVCQEWLDSFEIFQRWALANGYADNLTIERRDNDLGYSPENCIWVDMSHQMANRRKKSKANNQYVGVDQIPGGNYRAKIKYHGKVTYLGVHPTAELAAKARDDYIILHDLPHMRSISNQP